jgi:Putative peptidoglycan binding domain
MKIAWICAIAFTLLASNAFAQRVLFPTDLHPGVKNEVAVIVLQKFLKAERFYDGPVLGIYDSTTAKAVQKFQERYSIRPSDGIFKGQTRARANSVIQGQLQSYTSATSTPPKDIPKAQKKVIPVKKTTPATPQNCFVAGSMISHGETKTMYRYPAAAAGGSCHSEKRTCENGFLDGDPGYRYTTCKGVIGAEGTTSNKAATATQKITCMQVADDSGTTQNLCATLPIGSRCSSLEYPCAYIGPDGKKACFSKVNNACPKVPKEKK